MRPSSYLGYVETSLHTNRPKILPAAQLAFVLTWSSGWITAEVAPEYAGVPLILFLRFAGAAVILAALRLTWLRRRGPSADAQSSSFSRIVATGILSQAIWLWAVIEAQRAGVSPGVNALMNAAQPMVTAALVSLLFRRPASPRLWIGMIVAFVGLAVVVADEINLGGTPLAAYAIPLISVASMTAAVILKGEHGGARRADTGAAARTRRRYGRVDTLLIQAIASALLPLAVILVRGAGEVQWGAAFGGIMLATILLPQLAAFGLLWFLVDRTSPSRASALFIASPPATMIMSRIFFGDPITAVEWIGTGVVVLGLVLGQGGRPRPLLQAGRRLRSAGRKLSVRTVVAAGPRSGRRRGAPLPRSPRASVAGPAWRRGARIGR